MEPKSKPPAGSERARDEQRADRGPAYGGEAWDVADERGEDRFGHARNDDADPLELVKKGEEDEDVSKGNPAGVAPKASEDADNDASSAELQGATDEDEIGTAESGGAIAGMGRGEKPRKPKSRAK